MVLSTTPGRAYHRLRQNYSRRLSIHRHRHYDCYFGNFQIGSLSFPQ